MQVDLEKAIRILSPLTGRLIGSGRTDAGVHAFGQVANFRTEKSISDFEKFIRSLNGILPRDISVLDAVEVDEDFCARKKAIARRYCYYILNRPSRCPLRSRHSFHFSQKLDIKSIRLALSSIEGTHDFAAFQAVDCDMENSLRTIYSAKLMESVEGMLFFDIEADGFLRHMVRALVGTFLWVGIGKLDVEGFMEILNLKDRAKAGPTAPACGLILMGIRYDQKYDRLSTSNKMC